MFNYLLLITLLAIFMSLQPLVQSKCLNNSQIKYQLKEPTYLTDYHSICNQFARRTCCSGKNFDTLSNKIINKLKSSAQIPTSDQCRRKLTNLMCSTCDADIGETQAQGICSNVCQNIYNSCQNDYFALDSLNKLKFCRDDDIICSKLSDILPPKEGASICEKFGYQINQKSCWNGIPSSIYKGVPNKKVSYWKTSSKSKKSSKSSVFRKILTRLKGLFKEPKYMTYISIVTLLLIFLGYKWFSIKRNDVQWKKKFIQAQNKRQIQRKQKKNDSNNSKKA